MRAKRELNCSGDMEDWGALGRKGQFFLWSVFFSLLPLLHFGIPVGPMRPIGVPEPLLGFLSTATGSLGGWSLRLEP